MSLPKRNPDISPSITLAEVSKLMEENSADLTVQIGNKILHLRQSDAESDANPKPLRNDRARIVAEEALFELREDDEWSEHVDEATGMTVLRHRNWTGKFDPETFIEAAAGLDTLIDWDDLIEGIEQSRLAEIERDRDLWGFPET